MDKKILVLNKFRPNSVSGRMVKYLSNGRPRTIAEVARAARPKSRENLTAPGGWYAKLRAYGKRSRKFNLSKIDGKLVMKVHAGR